MNKLLVSLATALMLAASTGGALAFNEHGDPQEGLLGYQMGCLINGVFFPENGACMEYQYNADRYEQSQNMNGNGVLLPPESPYDLLPDAANDAVEMQWQ